MTFLRNAQKPCLLLCSAAFVVSAIFAAAQAAPTAPASTQTRQHHPGTSSKPPASPKRNPLKDTEDALRNAQSPAEARSLEAHAETLRQRHLSPSSLLLIQHANKALGTSSFREAEADISSAMTLQPDHAFLRRSRAQIRYAAGDFEGAISDLGVVLQADPNDPVAWSLLSRVEEERHNPRAALDAMQHLISVDPLAAGGLKRLHSLQTTLDGHPT